MKNWNIEELKAQAKTYDKKEVYVGIGFLQRRAGCPSSEKRRLR